MAIKLSRRQALHSGSALLAGATVPGLKAGLLDAAEAVHREIWRRFIDEHGILLDYTDHQGRIPRSTPEECLAGKPNALSWWTPIENGSMFNGGYLDAACLRAARTGAAEDREKAARLAAGLMKLASCGTTPGFIARGLATDGRTCYPMGSNDQTAPWLYGMWRYVSGGLAGDAEKSAIIAKMLEIGRVLESTGWRMPCNAGAPSPYRGTFAGFTWEHAPRLLFLLRALHHVSGKEHWLELYRSLINERGGTENASRLEICGRGMIFESTHRHSWTGASSVICLRGLWEMEEEPAIRDTYARGLAASARLAAEGLPLWKEFRADSHSAFLYDWRVLNQWWAPQHSEAEAVAVAEAESKELRKLSPRRREEFHFVREPAFAAWVVSMCPDRAVVELHRADIEEMAAGLPYAQLYYSQFFPLEAAGYRIAQA